MKRAPILALVLLGVAFAAAALVQAASIKKPPTGPWTVPGTAGGFTLKSGKGSQKGKVVLASFKLTTGVVSGCPEVPIVAKVVGKYPLRTFTRGGYTAWGVGKNQGGDVTPMPGSVSAGGKTYSGSFYLVWDYSDPHQVIGGSIEFDSCRTELTFAHPK